MAGAHILAAQSAQQNFAGNTRPNVAATQAGAPAPPTAGEGLAIAGIRSDLESILSGGLHPEAMVAAIAAPASRALEHIPQWAGNFGGARPAPYSAAQPGPAGESVAARGRALLSRIGLNI